MFHAQVSERMKVVDVLSTRVYSDSQQIIAQVNNVFVQSAFIGLFFFLNSTCFCAPLQLLCCFLSQGDLADCFYIVESGQVRITMKRSRVSLHRHPLDKPLIKKKKSLETQSTHFFFSARQKQTKKKRRWTSLHAPGASILGSLLSSQTNPELHLPMLWGVSNAWVNFVQFCARSFIYRAKDAHLPVKHILFCTILFKFTSKS